MNSGIYSCRVNHTRLHPKRHAFDYRIFYLDIDLDELPQLSRKLLPFSHNRFNLFSFFDRDHLAIDPDKTTLRRAVSHHLKRAGAGVPSCSASQSSTSHSGAGSWSTAT